MWSIDLSSSTLLPISVRNSLIVRLDLSPDIWDMCIIGVVVCVLLIGTVNLVLYEMESGLKGDLGTVNGKLYFEKNGTSYPPSGSIITESLGNEVLNRNEVDQSKSTKALFVPVQGSNNTQYTMVIGQVSLCLSRTKKPEHLELF